MPAPAPLAAMTALPGAPAAPAYTMTPAAGGFTREQYHAQGWSDADLIAKGMMIASAPAAAPAAPAPAPAPAPAAPVYVMTQAAGGFTREQYAAQGWSDADLIAKGMMIQQ